MNPLHAESKPGNSEVPQSGSISEQEGDRLSTEQGDKRQIQGMVTEKAGPNEQANQQDAEKERTMIMQDSESINCGPCPFCKDLPAPKDATNLSYNGRPWQVICRWCGCSGPRCGTAQRARILWSELVSRTMSGRTMTCRMCSLSFYSAYPHKHICPSCERDGRNEALG